MDAGRGIHGSCTMVSLVVQDLPTLWAVSPNGRPAGLAVVVLEQGVREEIEMGCQFAALKVRSLPDIGVRIGPTLFQHIEHEVAAVASAGSADFPEIGRRHLLEFGARCAEFRAMEDRL